MEFICRKIIPSLLFMLLCSCGEDYKLLTTFKGFRNINNSNDSLIKFDSIDNKYYVVQSIPESIGIMADYRVPKEYGKNKFKVVINGKFKTNNPTTNSEIVISTINDRDLDLTFTGKRLRYYTLDVNQICSYKDSFFLKYDNWETLKNISIRSYLFKSTDEIIKFDTIYVSVYYLN
jgi:hypothetical protein